MLLQQACDKGFVATAQVHARPFVGVSQKSFVKRTCQVLALNAHTMAPRTTQWLQERPWNAPTKGRLRPDPLRTLAPLNSHHRRPLELVLQKSPAALSGSWDALRYTRVLETES